MFNQREPGMMKSEVFCTVWYYILLSVQVMSMYVVMLLSVSRAIVIHFPFYKINKKLALATVPVYFLHQATWIILSFISSSHVYSLTAGFCQREFRGERMIPVVKTLYHINYCVSTGVPPIAVFVSLVVSLKKLHQDTNELSDGENGENSSHRNNRQASLAILYFSATFLLCNSFTFVNTVLFTITYVVRNDYPGKIYSNTFMFFYSWSISEIFCTVLNATLNPLLYYWRMKEFRSWVKNLLVVRL